MVGARKRKMQIFTSLTQAIAAGYSVYERTHDGYLVRTKIGNRFALALVVIGSSGKAGAKSSRSCIDEETLGGAGMGSGGRERKRAG